MTHFLYDKLRGVCDKVKGERMSKLILPLCLLALSPAHAQQFTVSGRIAGIKKGCEVKLIAIEGYGRKDIAKGVTDEGGFTLTGKVDAPTLATIEINDKPQYADGEYARDRGVRFMLENVPVTIEAAHFDSIPLSYEMGGTPLRLERNVRVSGGEMQRHYQEWRDYIYEAELTAWHADHLVWLSMFGDRGPKKDKEGLTKEQKEEAKKQKEKTSKLMEQAARATGRTVDHLNSLFIAAHPTYAVSLMLQSSRMENMFTYTNAELDSILAMLKDNEDKAGYERLSARIDGLRKFAKGTLYTDFAVRTPEGTAKNFSDFIKKGCWNYIDMWASWCGPCRAAIPAVKELHKEMGDRLNVVSVSVDKDDAAWKRAMNEELMPWTQLIAPKESTKILQASYNLSSIPYLLIINPEGRIVLSTHEPQTADEYILNAVK